MQVQVFMLVLFEQREKYKLVILWLMLAVVYIFVAKLGLNLAFEQINTSPVWPSTGIAISALLFFGTRCWPGIFLGALVTNMWTSTPIAASLMIASGNTLEAVFACLLIVAFTNRYPFDTISNIVKFVTIVIFATMISATIGVLSLLVNDIIQFNVFSLLWLTWWLGDLVGALVVTPFLLAWLKINKKELRSYLSLDALLVVIFTFVIAAIVFSGWFPLGEENYPLAFIYLPVALWSAYRFQLSGATLVILAITAFAIYGTLNGYGPFVRESINESLLLLQSFIAIVMITTLIMTASMNENRKANKELAKSQDELKQIVRQQTGDLQSAADEIELAASVFNESVESIVITDKYANILRVNPAFTQITGYCADEVMGKNINLLRSGRQNKEFYHEFWSTLLTKKSWQGEIWDKRKNGEIFPAWQTITAVRDKAGDIFQYISIFSDISEKKLSEERIYHLAHFDSLTELRNREAFRDQLEKAIAHASRQDVQLALLYIDLDNFKLINDASGHPVGDLLLKHFAKRISNSVREEDTVARFGGDEFVILIANIQDAQTAVFVAEKILEEMAKPILLDHYEVVVTGSIGISSYPTDGLDADMLLKNADVAMYKAKGKGRNNYQFFTAAMNEQAEERLTLENDMRKALLKSEFVLHYQPQLDLNSGEIIGCEALVRWQHPTRGLIFPGQFIFVAEQSGLIRELGAWVMRSACEQQRRWYQETLKEITIAVNVSARQFLSQQLIVDIQQIINDTGIEPGCLELELTESIIMEYVEENIRVLESLHGMGVKLAVDDFGTGYSSMAYLKRFPIDKLKIDRGFVQDIAVDDDDAAIVRAITVLAQSLHLKVIAEGVETSEQLQFLKGIGCDEMQGFYFSRAIPADDMTKLILQNAKLK